MCSHLRTGIFATETACVSEWRVITTHIKQQLQSQDTTPTYPDIPRRNQGLIEGALPRKRAERDALRCSAPGLADETHTRKTRPGSDKTSEILRPPRGRGLTRSWAGSWRAHPARVPTTNPPRRLDIDSSASDSPPEYARITRCPHADRMRLRGFLLVGPGAMTYIADQIQLQHNST